jgi:hypothetical protein
MPLFALLQLIACAADAPKRLTTSVAMSHDKRVIRDPYIDEGWRHVPDGPPTVSVSRSEKASSATLCNRLTSIRRIAAKTSVPVEATALQTLLTWIN